MSRRALALSFLSVLALAVACSSSEGSSSTGPGSDGDAGPSGSGSNSASGGGAGTAGGSSSAGRGGFGNYGGQTLAGLEAGVVTRLCGSTGCQCSNGIDDDHDGQIDGFDTECTGPLDNDEGTFATGIPGDNQDPKWQDCFFDGNSGAGDDGCRYPTDCLTGKIDAADSRCAVTQSCQKFCGELTPNGCDCFGCCTVGTGAGAVDVRIEATCSTEKLGDEKACPRCVKSTTCNNECGTCELCPGKTVADLPASCNVTPPADGGQPPATDAGYPPPPPNTCDFGRTPCSATSPCDSSHYCSQGCCVVILR